MTAVLYQYAEFGLGPAHVLYASVGGGHVSYPAAPRMHSVVACELSAEMLRAVEAEASKRAITNLRTVQAPAERLPFEDKEFGVAATRFSAHHWGDLDAGLRQVARVLQAGGLFVIVDVASPGQPLLETHLQAVELLRDPGHVRNYSAAEWLASLTRAGFAIEEVRASRIAIEFESWIRRMRTSDIAVCRASTLMSATVSHVGRFCRCGGWIRGRASP